MDKKNDQNVQIIENARLKDVRPGDHITWECAREWRGATTYERREGIAAEIDDPLLALYDRIRDSSGGLGAAEFTHGRCGGCRLELNPVDVSAIERAASDEVVRCEECSRILVRTHSGD